LSSSGALSPPSPSSSSVSPLSDLHSPQSKPLVEAAGIIKRYGSVLALSGLDLKVMPGEIYGLLGPNGAGKSTMIRIITGLLEPTSGYLRVMGYDPSENPVEVKSLIGYVSENPLLYESLTPRDFFEFVASVRRIDRETANRRVSYLSRAFGLIEYYDSPIATLSMGTKQKVAIIAALIHEPPLLLLDEPLNGLDAKTSRILKDIISFHTKEKNGAVLFSTHIMEIAQTICDRIGIIYQGKIVAEGSLDQLRQKINTGANASSTTLEEVFLKLTHEEEEIAKTVSSLREAFLADKS
jgi:ABC-2 type transport system ATP-binding protein